MTCLTPSEIKLTQEQRNVFEEAVRRARNGASSSIGGLAGSGKTTVSGTIYRELTNGGLTVLFLAPTGKAASVLINKGIPAHTIHSAIYDFKGTKVDDEGDEHLLFEPKKKKVYADVVMVDETSMVNRRQFKDIVERIPTTIWIGDPGQLPPVQDAMLPILEKPTFKLKEIHRQALDNPVIAWAHQLRRGRPLSQRFEGINHVTATGPRRAAEEMLTRGVDVTLVKTNRIRVKLNQAVRAALNLDPDNLTVGDRVICLQNNKHVGLVNGDMLVVEELRNLNWITARRASDNEVVRFRYVEGQLNNPSKMSQEDAGSSFNPYNTIFLDYAYAITCHKMQGSSASHIGIVADGFCGDLRKWNYTAATRAEEQVTVFCNGE